MLCLFHEHFVGTVESAFIFTGGGRVAWDTSGQNYFKENCSTQLQNELVQ